ncbi:MAG: DNA polymerase IV [Puniceicoccales bacterium]|nr:DNA polymerase IV [Puniceicoccales bacterium]
MVGFSVEQMAQRPRKILHVDMDAFFAAVEQLDNPKLLGKPVIVGGSPWGRGVVSTCSYEARKFGVHSAMASRMAIELCPHAIFLPCRMERYAAVSADIFVLLRSISGRVEPLSVDEAFVDVTENALGERSATAVARHVQKMVAMQIGLSCSVGVSCNCFLAKLASRMAKPAGVYVIEPKRAMTFIAALPVRNFYGIGRATAKKLEARQIFTGKDMRAMELGELVELFGSKVGRRFYELARAIDLRPVVAASSKRKSLSRECTFAEDLKTVADVHWQLGKLAAAIGETIRNGKLRWRTITLKLRYGNFETTTRSRTFQSGRTDDAISASAVDLFGENAPSPWRPIRLLGVALSSLDDSAVDERRWIQMELPLKMEMEAPRMGDLENGVMLRRGASIWSRMSESN